MAEQRNWLNLTWSEKTWSERAQTVIANVLAGIVGIGMLLGIIFVLGMIIDTQDQRREELHRCLKNATNGLAIEECKR